MYFSHAYFLHTYVVLPVYQRERERERAIMHTELLLTALDVLGLNLFYYCALIGDQIDSQYEEEMKEIVELAGSPETAFSIFSDVVKKLFEWDSQEGGKTIL